MRSLDVAGLTNEQRPTGVWAVALLQALARVESAGRRPQRLTEPGQARSVRDDDMQPSGLCAFFEKALDPTPEKRFPSARAMRDALLVALGEDIAAVVVRRRRRRRRQLEGRTAGAMADQSVN